MKILLIKRRSRMAAGISVAIALCGCDISDPRDRVLDDWVKDRRKRSRLQARLTPREAELFHLYLVIDLRDSYWDGMLPNHPGITVREIIRKKWCEEQEASYRDGYLSSLPSPASEEEWAHQRTAMPAFVCPPTPDFRAAGGQAQDGTQ